MRFYIHAQYTHTRHTCVCVYEESKPCEVDKYHKFSWHLMSVSLSFLSFYVCEHMCLSCHAYVVEMQIKFLPMGVHGNSISLHNCSPKWFSFDACFPLQTSNFPVLDPTWTAQEEMALLEAVMDCGFGNWWELLRINQLWNLPDVSGNIRVVLDIWP